MRWLYQGGILAYGMMVRLASMLGHRQARMWVQGRKQAWGALSNVRKARGGRKLVWLHAASAGEFEQGRPILDALKVQIPDVFVLVSFFSPSGYNLHHSYRGADLVVYLPEDSESNALKWMEWVQPNLSLFVKYEYWYHYYRAHRLLGVPLWVVSAPFRRSQPFFRYPTAGFWGQMLESVDHFYVLNAESKALLQELGIERVTINGDTRIDRVLNIRNTEYTDPILDAFCHNARVLVAGSTWPADEKLLLEWLVQENKRDLQSPYKLILVPHHPDFRRIDRQILQATDIRRTMLRWTTAGVGQASDAQILWIDQMGMLSRLYRYGCCAWVGGGMGAGIHNILEAAVYGIPVGFGPNHQRFFEAGELIKQNWAFTARTPTQLKASLDRLLANPGADQIREGLHGWFNENRGASQRITEHAVALLGH